LPCAFPIIESLYSVPIVIIELVDPSTCVWLVPPPLLFFVNIVSTYDQYMIIVMFFCILYDDNNDFDSIKLLYKHILALCYSAN